MRYPIIMECEKRVVQCDNLQIGYTLWIKKVKNITLKIEQNGAVSVICNAYVPRKKVDEFVIEKISWILQKQQKIQEKQRFIYQDILLDEVFYLYGKPLKIVRRESFSNRVYYDESHLYVHYSSKEKANQNVISFIRKCCIQQLTPKVEYHYERMKEQGIPYPQIKYRTMKSRWGSCTPAKASITLNTRLIHYPIAFIEYVIVHELAHFIQPNHSKSFYRVVENYLPDYRERMNIVK